MGKKESGGESEKNNKKSLEDAYQEALNSLPENFKRLVLDGYTPVYYKPLDKWALRKLVNGKRDVVYVPKEFSDSMQIIKAFHMKKKADTLVQASDFVLEGKIREIPKDERKPIIKKEIEDAAWVHNLYHDLGKYAYHQLVKYVDWSPNDTKDSDQAFSKLKAYFDTLLNYRDQAKVVQELQEQNLKYDMYATYLESKMREAIDYVNELKATIQKQQVFIQSILDNLDPDSSRRILSALVATLGTPVLTQEVEPETSIEEKPEKVEVS